MKLKVLAVVATTGAMLALTGCETMSPEACRLADWRALGYQDGADGASVEKFSRRQQSCAKAGVVGDFDLYAKGRDEGLRSFCRPDNGFQVGLRGSSYGNVCPADLDGPFRLAYLDGARAHEALGALRSVESALSRLRSDRTELERKISANEASLIAAQTDEERKRYRDELIRLRDQRSNLDYELRSKESELSGRNSDLARVRAEIGFRWGSW